MDRSLGRYDINGRGTGQVDRKMYFRFTSRILYAVGFRRQVAKKYDCDRIVILHYSGRAPSYRTHVARGYRAIQ